MCRVRWWYFLKLLNCSIYLHIQTYFWRLWHVALSIVLQWCAILILFGRRLFNLKINDHDIYIAPYWSTKELKRLLSQNNKVLQLYFEHHQIFHFCLSGLTRWRHQMETFSALLVLCAENSPVTGEFPPQRPVTRSFDVFFDMRLNKGLSKQSWGWWFETPSCPLLCHCNEECIQAV